MMSYAPRSACSNKLSLYETSHSSFLFLYRLAPAMVPKATIGVNADRTAALSGFDVDKTSAAAASAALMVRPSAKPCVSTEVLSMTESTGFGCFSA